MLLHLPLPWSLQSCVEVTNHLPNLLRMLLPMQPTVPLTFTKAPRWLSFNSASTWPPRVFSAKLLSSWMAPNTHLGARFSCLFKYSLTQYSHTKAKSSPCHTFPLVSGGWDGRGRLFPAQTEVQKSLSASLLLSRLPSRSRSTSVLASLLQKRHCHLHSFQDSSCDEFWLS